jgi:predicted O-methyltransferase YrrM
MAADWWRYWRPSSIRSVWHGWQTRLQYPLESISPAQLVPSLDSELVQVAVTFDGGMVGDSGVGKIALVCGMAKAIGARRILEVGTCGGFMTRHLALNCGPESHVWTIDLPEENADATIFPLRDVDREIIEKVARGHRPPGWYAAVGAERDRITQILCDSARYDYADLSTPLDFAFIDGAHSYEYVLVDSVNALTRLRAGGIVVWDDYLNFFPGVLRAVGEIGRLAPVRALRGTGLAAVVLPETWLAPESERQLRALVARLTPGD